MPWIRLCVAVVICGLCALAIPETPAHAVGGPPGKSLIKPEEAAAFGASWVLDREVRDLAKTWTERSPFVERVSRGLSFLGGTEGLPFVVGSLWLIDSDLGESALQSVVATGALTYAVKAIFGRPRPFTGERGLRGMSLKDEYHSFPSGHSSVAFGLAGTISAKRPEWREEAYALAFLVAGSRVFLDQHWLSDVVAGAILGTALGRAGEPRFGWSWAW